MQAHAAAYPATPEATFALVGPETGARTHSALARFELAIQSLLDAPLDAARVLEWTALRTLNI